MADHQNTLLDTLKEVYLYERGYLTNNPYDQFPNPRDTFINNMQRTPDKEGGRFLHVMPPLTQPPRNFPTPHDNLPGPL